MLPEVIEKMQQPTQFYLSLDAPNQEIHKRINIPLLEDSWQRLNKTLEIMAEMPTRRVIRITCVNEWNMLEPEKYAELIKKSNTDFIEVKAFMLVGESRERLKIQNMPSHEQIREFARNIESNLPGYKIIDEQPISRVVLLSNGSKPNKIDFSKIGQN
jgi:tRNA wybutosine-synthesizing protein 1